MKEVIDLRKPREKHFLNEDGTHTLYVYNQDVHFLKNGIYQEMDLTLIEKEEGYTHKENPIAYTFSKKISDEFLLKMEKEKDYFFIDFEKKEIHATLNKNKIFYENILENINIEYESLPEKIKETIILKKPTIDFKNLVYKIKTNLKLKLNENGQIIATNQEQQIFTITPPTLTDKNQKEYPIAYSLETKENAYYLYFQIEESILNNENIYPLFIDPTIDTSKEESVLDTYIYPGDENTNRNGEEILKVGVDENSTVYRTLMKFVLPNIGTSSNVIDARVSLTSHKTNIEYNEVLLKRVEVHRINTFWDEVSANWNTMHNQYEAKIEDYFTPNRSVIENNTLLLKNSYFRITDLVKRWYAGLENNGILLKVDKENYNQHTKVYGFYSKNNNASQEHNIENPKPYLILTYRNQNGLESYMTYQNIAFEKGTSYINNLTGNVTNVFEINKTIGSKIPLNLELIYNTNDSLLVKDYGGSTGYKWNYYQTIKETNEKNYILEYLDEDSTLHYFKKTSDGKIIDEDGLGLTAQKDADTYILKDKVENKLTFQKRKQDYYLIQIENAKKDAVKIEYNEENKIVKLIDSNQEEVNITYVEDKILVSSLYFTTTLNLENEMISSIENKFGKTSFTYNENKIVTEITDTNQKKIKYSYYETIPYRLKKIEEIGLEGKSGTSLEFTYDFNITRVKDHKGRTNAYSFNNQGNTVCITTLEADGDIKKSYGIQKEYFNETKPILKNKLQLEASPLKYTKNYLEDSSFEQGSVKDSLLSRDYHHSGTCSLKVEHTYTWYTSTMKLEKEGAYTFSGYFKTDIPATLRIEYSDNSTTETKRFREVRIEASEEFVRYSIPFYVSETYKKDFFHIELASDDVEGIIYIDDIQLEEGEIANYYNLIENSDFSKGTKSWFQEMESVSEPFAEEPEQSGPVTITENQKSYKICSRPIDSITVDQQVKTSGKKGDTYHLSFWYKDEGILNDDFTSKDTVAISFQKTGETNPYETFYLNPGEWQMFQKTIVAKKEYDAITLKFSSKNNVNNFYFTNITLVKDLGNTSYEYDEEGNLISVKNKNKGISEFKYDKNNQLIAAFNPKGNHFAFEYDNEDAKKLLQGISKKGISNQIEYDAFDNPIKTMIKNNDTSDISNHSFYIRLKSTDQYILPNYKQMNIELKTITCSNECWDFLKENDQYSIQSSVIPLYLTQSGTLEKEEKTYFEIIKNENGSVSFKLNDKCLTVRDGDFVLESYTKENENQQFYLEPYESKKSIETSAEYTSDGKFIKTTTDALGKRTEYDIDPLTGLIKKITDPNESVTTYTYNEKDQITTVEKEGKNVSYTYNNQNELAKIICENKEYNFTYDEFLNAKEVKVNNQLLVTHEYEENNGNLIFSNYGNNTNISYTYDELDRVKTLAKGNKVYTHIYNNQNGLAKITTENEIYNYYYDLAERLSKYEIAKKGQDENDFRIETIEKLFTIDYDYDVNNNITEKIYDHKNNRQTITYTYDEDDSIIKVKLDDNIEENFNYDELGRLKNQNINNQIPVEYEYYQNGNKTSLVLKSMKIENDLYEYIYDTLYNITHIYKNKELQNYYVYDDLNELLEDHNYSQNKKIKYQYDTSGNILKKQEYDLNTNTLLHADTYEYTNLNWKDQLTKFNDTNITYDEIGNPTTIGDDTLTWWGRELQSYQNNMFQINYSYNKEGIRNKKIVNGVETNYYVENSNIIFEETNGNALYYMRTDKNNLIGLKYNDETYYYKKNYQGDIIGIYNSNYEEIATYEYDSFGNIVSIKDANGGYITDSNHIAIINPYRYRSYYYDIETGLYYLNSRYYNPLWGRFINADGIIGTSETILGYNLYAYCENNPIIYEDGNGNFTMALLGGIGAIALLAIAAVAPRTFNPVAGAITKRIETVRERKKQKELEAVKEIEKATTKSKTATVIIREQTQKPCTTAKIIDGDVTRGSRLTISQSQQHVEMGGDVMCDNQFYALQVAMNFQGYIGPERDLKRNWKPGNKYYFHYHPDRNSHRHIWFLGLSWDNNN